MDDDFDIDFKLLPPKLQMQLWVLALDADTGKVNLAYRRGAFRSSLGYGYGGNLTASMAVRRFRSTIKVDPTNGDTDLGLVYRGFRFNTKAGFAKRSFGVGFGYGAPLLPMPMELADTFHAANAGFGRVAGNLSAAPNDPRAWAKVHKDDFKAMSKAYSVGQKLMKQQKSDQRFGVGLRLTYSPETQFTIVGGAMLLF